ncbi:hypothetical protein T05_6498, partial [Trichinella murrelli]
RIVFTTAEHHHPAVPLAQTVCVLLQNRRTSNFLSSVTMAYLFHTAILIFSLVHLNQAQQTFVAMPFNKANASAMLTAINKARSVLQVALMECVQTWDSKLAAYAQEVANTCNAAVPADAKYPLAISLIGDVTNPKNPAADELLQGFAEILNSFNPTDNSCNGGALQYTDASCNSMKQFYWMEMNTTGCGVAKCDSITNADPTVNVNSGYQVVCAYDLKAVTTSRPFPPNADPNVPQSCYICPTQKSLCDSSTMHLCCASPTSDLSFIGEFGGDGACGSQPKNLKPVFRYYDKRLGSNILSFESEPSSFPEALSKEPGRFDKFGAMGAVLPKDATSAECPFLEPIYHVYSPIRYQNIYTLDKREYDARIKEGYESKGIVGKAVSGYMMCNATVSMYRFFRPPSSFFMMTNSTTLDAIFNNLVGKPGSYMYEGVSFYLWPTNATEPHLPQTP